MFTELVELGRRISRNHPALDNYKCDYDIVIKSDGEFIKFIKCDYQVQSEYIPPTAKKGKARLLLDKAEETFGFDEKKHQLYLAKIDLHKDIPSIKPILSFYYDNKSKGIDKAIIEFKNLKNPNGNFSFIVDDTRVLDIEEIRHSIIRKYEDKNACCSIEDSFCAVCGKNEYPIVDEPHGGVNLPGSDKKCSLVSYNDSAYLSYSLKGNLNSGICINCARLYMEALSHLTSFEWKINDKGKKYKDYDNAREISDDTLIVYWTKNASNDIDVFSDIYEPTVERVRNLFNAISQGDADNANTDVDNFFYSFTISSAAARAAIRDWMTISISQYQRNIKQWFEDIATLKDGNIYYPGINTILSNCIKKKDKPTQSDYKAKARIGSMLWHAALTNTSLPILILNNVLNQIEHTNTGKNKKNREEDKNHRIAFTVEQSTVIRLILNRNINNKYKMKKELDEQNESKAYLCGRLFALICKLQFKAQNDVNSSIKDRFFASASNVPARVFGLLLTKYVPIYEKKTKGAYNKSITEIAARIGHFPDMFSVIERGEFALGYYYQYNAKQNESTNNQ